MSKSSNAAEKKSWRLSKKQLKIVEALQNGGYIWVTAGKPYLMRNDNGHYTPELLHQKTFRALIDHSVVTAEPGRDDRFKLS